MKICFLDKTSFQYNYNDLNSPKLRGAETTLLNLSYTISKMGHDVTVINNCPENKILHNIRWININELNENYEFDLAISNNDCNFFKLAKAKKRILLSHSLQNIEKFIRKRQFFSYLKYKPKVALLGKYHYKNRSLITKIFGHFFLPYGVDDIFLNSKLINQNEMNRNQAIFFSSADRNLKLLIQIWKDHIFTKHNHFKLLVTPNKFKDNKDFNIFPRNLGDKVNLINDLCNSRVCLIPGHKAELFCLAAEEARELCLPIVTLGIGSLSERVVHGKTGFIAKNEKEFANFTLEIFKNDNLWIELRSNLNSLRGSRNWKNCAYTLLNNI